MAHQTFEECAIGYDKGRGALLFNNNDTDYSVGGYNNSKRTNYKENNDNAHEDYENRYNGKHNKFGGRNRQQDSDGPRHGNNRGGDNDRKWQSNRRNQYDDGETEDIGFNGHDRSRRDRDDRGERGDNGGGRDGGYGRNRDNDDNDFEDRKPRRDRGERGGRGDGRDGDYGRNKVEIDINMKIDIIIRNRYYHHNDNDNNDFEDRGHGRNDDESKEKPKKEKSYIPSEQPNDEGCLFGNEVTMGINFNKYDDIEVKVTGEGAPHPIQSFDQSGLRTILLENIKMSGYTKPTPVQKYAIPIIMSGRDVMVCAQTGSGKTAAFVLPILHSLLQNRRNSIKTNFSCEPYAIIVSPTCVMSQIYDEFKKFSLNSIIRIEVIYKGPSILQQTNKANGCHVLIATPGKLLDFIERGNVVLSSLRFFVLNEADKMLKLGFLSYIERIIQHKTMVAAKKKQMLMFSATFPNKIQELAGRFLQNYLFLEVGIIRGACANVEQIFELVCDHRHKRELLIELIEKKKQFGNLNGTLIFVEQKKHTNSIAAFLTKYNCPATSIHGFRFSQKEKALFDFNEGKILIVSAVAARGLDIKNVSHVINFDFPRTIDEYVHRIGRVGNCGKVTSFMDVNSDMFLTRDLIKILKQADQLIPDWMEDFGGEGSENYFVPGNDRFGGEDIRGVKMVEKQLEVDDASDSSLKLLKGAYADVEHNFYWTCSRSDKIKLLKELFKQNQLTSMEGTLIFVDMKLVAGFVACVLSGNIYSSAYLVEDNLEKDRRKS
ncbi:ATP-dependent RNA helicase vasa [Solenopsis invicta]|uniref:ATP-dependent RNA helicase vasa n=1 Tax=Solenopsis invicta TaxID=13686 RepID=UPI00193E8354|nr:ATP-dependent RNA helicase vasa [Solenopsis invicta]